MVTLDEVRVPLLTVFWVRADPSSLSTLTLPDDGIKAMGVMPQISNPRMSCSPPMNVREKGGTNLPPYPVMLLPIRCNARMWLLCQGAGWKYLASMVGRMVFTFPPSALPAKSKEMNRLRPPVGVMGWFTVL